MSFCKALRDGVMVDSQMRSVQSVPCYEISNFEALSKCFPDTPYFHFYIFVSLHADDANPASFFPPKKERNLKKDLPEKTGLLFQQSLSAWTPLHQHSSLSLPVIFNHKCLPASSTSFGYIHHLMWRKKKSLPILFITLGREVIVNSFFWEHANTICSQYLV